MPASLVFSVNFPAKTEKYALWILLYIYGRITYPNSGEAERMKKGLILEGGAMRGLFTAGVTDVMMENGIEFDGMIGVSAGACFGCNYKSRQPGRTLRYNLQYCRDPRYCSFRSLIKTGDLYGADFCYLELPKKLDLFDYEAFLENPMEFYVVCTDVETGEPVYRRLTHGDRNEMHWIRASASMPLASRIVEVDGYKLLDGGIADSIPLKYFESIGYDRNVVILTQPADYVKKPNKLIPLMRRALRKYPRVVDTMARRHEIYNEATAYIREKERAGEVFVIRPAGKLEVGHVEHDPDKLRAAYELGRRAGEEHLAAMKRFLGLEDGKQEK